MVNKVSKREFNTPERDSWNAPIHQILKAIDAHNAAFFVDRNLWHIEKAEMLRCYLHELKTWIHKQESISNEKQQ